MLKSTLTDRRLWLLGGILVLVVVFCRWLIPVDRGFLWVTVGGYWATLFLLVLFIRAVWPVAVARWRQTNFGRFELGVGVGILAVVGVWVAHERPGYKILADELLLSGTAMGMHYEREAAYPMRATDVNGAFQILSHTMDKRPLLFPFLVATVHDLTGYRPENPFYLNLGFSAVFLWLVYLVGWKVGRSRWAGVAAGLLFSGLPLLAQQATGGGFELLNLLLIAAFTLLMAYYLEGPDSVRLEAVVFGALLLASTRYESAIFLVPALVAAFFGWWRSGRVMLSWPLIVSPFFLAPVLLQNRLFEGSSTAWQMASQVGVSEPFGIQYFAPNLGHALAYFFDFSGYLTNSPTFAVLGLLCLPVAGLWMARVYRNALAVDGEELALALAGAGLFGVTAVYLFYFWGKFDDPIISRLSLPVHFLMAIALILVGRLVFKREKGWKIIALTALGGMLIQGIPVMAKQAYRTSYAPGVEMGIRADFLGKLTDRNILFIDNDSFYWILQKIPASPVKQSRLRRDGLAYHMRNHSFQDMYVFQSVTVNDATGVLSVDPADELGPDFELETVVEKRVQTLLFARISRIVAIKDENNTVTRPRVFVDPQARARTAEELDASRAHYMQNWIKQLP